MLWIGSLPDDGKLILYVGRLEKYKNIHLIIPALKHLPEDYYLYIIGEGPYQTDLIKLIKNLNLTKHVKILGHLSDKETNQWMKTSSVFITLSDIEAFGITVLEALAANTPVIVNNKGGLSELADKFPNEVMRMESDVFSNHKKFATR